MFNGPDGWSSGWLVNCHHFPTRLQCQQGGSGVVFWPGIIRKDLAGHFRISGYFFRKVWKSPRKNMWRFSMTTFFHGTKKGHFLQQNYLHAWYFTISCCKEYLCIIGCCGHKRKKNSWCGPHPHLTSTPLRTFGRSLHKISIRGQAVHIQTEALGGSSDLLQRNSSWNDPKNSEGKIVKLLSNKGSYVEM